VFGSFIAAGTFALLVAPKLGCVAIAPGTDEYFSLMVRRAHHTGNIERLFASRLASPRNRKRPLPSQEQTEPHRVRYVPQCTIHDGGSRNG
jgi:hypothetical protein